MLEHPIRQGLTPRCYPDTSTAYLAVLTEVLHYPQYECAPRGLKIKEILEVGFSVLAPADAPIKTLDAERNKVIESYTAKEFALYASGSNSGDDFAAAAKFWGGLKNPDGTINSAYGKLIFSDKSHGDPNFEVPGYEPGRMNLAGDAVMRTPWEWAKLCLINDKDTRQAIFHVNLPDHAWLGTKDYPCTLHGQFFIREGRLDLSMRMRSNDVWRGLVYDMPWFCYLQKRMLKELELSILGLRLGIYTHHAASMHLYDRDWAAAAKALAAA